MSVDDSRTGDVHVYWIHPARSTLVPFCGWPQLPQPTPAPGLDDAGVVGSLTRRWFSHGAVPVVVTVAAEPKSATTAFGARVTATVAAERRAPSEAKNRKT